MSEALLATAIPLRESAAAAALAGYGRVTLCVNDPPYAALAASLPAPARVVRAGSMERAALEQLHLDDVASDTVVGLGGGSAIDTAKYLAWRSGKPLVQIPTITSVDAAFTDAIGVREQGKVRYIGQVLAREVVLDTALVRSAPAHMNRAGVGDVLSCHTGLWDWAAAVRRGKGAPWHDDAAALGRGLLAELAMQADAIARVDATAVRFLASAYQRIGAACAALRHSRFEEGAEHFLAYTYEHLTDRHPLHGELIALFVVAASCLQDNDVAGVRSLVARCDVRAHPADLGVTRDEFVATLCGAHNYSRAEGLDWSVLDEVEITSERALSVWDVVDTLPRVS